MIFFGFFGVWHINRGQTEYDINSWILPNKVVASLLLLKGLTMVAVLGIFFSFVKVSSHLFVHCKAFFKTLKKSRQLSVARETNLFNATTFLVKLCTSFTILGDFTSITTFILSGLASMPY